MGTEVTRRSAKNSFGGSSALVAAVVLGIPLLTGVILAVWALVISPLESAGEEQPLIGMVEADERRDSELTSVTLVPADPSPVVSQSAGTITALTLEPGRPIAPGDVPLEVDGRPVIAYIAPAPLFRDITPGLEGEDVTIAQHLLVALGLLDGVSGEADAAMVAAIGEFNVTNGYGANGTVLHGGSLVWIPEGSAAPVTVTARVGQVIAPQSELYATTFGVDRVLVGSPADDVDRTLNLAGTRVLLAAGQVEIADPADVEAIGRALGGASTMSASLESLTVREVGTVPASAVIVGSDGLACFYADVTGEPRGIDATHGTFGIVDVDPSLIGNPVLINPRAVREDLACDS